MDQRADIYALAQVSYELHTGTQPWPSGLSEFEVLTRKADGDLSSLAEHRPVLPPELGQVLATGLYADPASRFASVAAFLTALDFAGAALPHPGAPQTQRTSGPGSGTRHGGSLRPHP